MRVESDSLPSDLSRYKVIFVAWRDSISAVENKQLAEYVKNAGSVYLEFLPSLLNDPPGFGEFGEQIGENVRFQPTALNVFADSVEGRIGTFAEGLVVRDPRGKYIQEMGYFDVDGLELVIYCQLWQSSRAERKVLFHFPQVSYAYPAVIERVLCDYFGLCVRGVASDQRLPQLRFDALRQSVVSEANSAISIVDMLGRTVLRSVGGSANVGLLASGLYFASTGSGGRLKFLIR